MQFGLKVDKVKTTGITICVAVLALIASVLWFLDSATNNYKKVNSSWEEYSKEEAKIVETALELTSSLGYGGMIHSFKNYVIRGDENYKSRLVYDVSQARFNLKMLYEHLHSKEEIEALAKLRLVIDEYDRHIVTVSQMHRAGLSADEIDQRVKVSDDAALKALAIIREKSRQRTQQVQLKTDSSINSSESFLRNGRILVIPIALMALLLFYYIKKIYASNATIVRARKWVDTLLDAAPEAIIIINKSGRILRVNDFAKRFFGYSNKELVGQKVEMLIPTRYAQVHSKLRDSFFIEPDARIMGVSREILALRKNKEEISVEISLNVAKIESETVAIASLRDITARKKSAEKILHQANYDSLTNLPNRKLAFDRLDQMIESSKTDNSKVGLLFLDLDGFKKINDTAGHEVGDALLITAAERLTKIVRGGDMVARLGGDEFIILLKELDLKDRAEVTANQLLESFRKPFTMNGRNLMLTASVGIAIYPENCKSSSELLRNAESAMYHSKDQGRDNFSYFTEAMNQKVTRRLALEEQMQGALSRGEFSIVYQPKISLSNGKIMGAEALLRWHNELLGSVPPDEFIPIAEQTGLILSIGKYVLLESLKTTAQWHKKYNRQFHIAVNLSPLQFGDTELVDYIVNTLYGFNLSGEYLELEVTEGVLMGDHGDVKDILLELHRYGISIAMDDFGTGYSSLNYLRSYPFDVLKIDRSFVNDIGVEATSKELINATIAMARGLNLKVVAEGVETTQQLDYLKRLNCDYVQGYLLSKPLAAGDFEKMLDANDNLVLKVSSESSQPESLLSEEGVDV